MKVSKYQEHILILPEDRANELMANGFLAKVKRGSMSVEKPTGGWKKVVEEFGKDFVPKMRQYGYSRTLLLIDFDQRKDRLDYIRQSIPEDLAERVFILGVWSEPEDLRRILEMSFEDIGEALASDCFNNTNELWNHALLKHNKFELERMISDVKPFLFN